MLKGTINVVFSVLLFLRCEPAHEAELTVREEEVEFFNGNTKFAATLFIPSSRNPMPAIAACHGSGKESRKDAGNRSLAMQLAQEGYVVLIYDKRGVGESQGVYTETPNLALPAADLVQAVQYLRKRSEVDANRIGVYGHSQGAWVAPHAASVEPEIDFVMVTCGGGMLFSEQNLYAYGNDLKAKGFTDIQVDSAKNYGATLFEYLASGAGYDEQLVKHKEAKKHGWFVLYRDMGLTDLPPPSYLHLPVFDFFRNIRYDPQAALSSLNIPVLVVLAGNDRSVPPERCRQQWQHHFTGAKSAKLTVVTLEGEDHAAWVRTEQGIAYKPSFMAELKKWANTHIR